VTIIAVLAGLLILATAVYLAWPLRRRAAATAAGGGELYHQLVRRRERLLAQLNELDVEEGDRNIDPAVAADERARLEAELAEVLRELDHLASAPSAAAAGVGPGDVTHRQWYLALAALLVLLPGAAGGLYLMHFTPPPEDPFALVTPGQIGPEQILAMVGRLERRLAENPDDPQGWARLGRSYAVLGRIEDAEKAYARGLRLAPDDRQILEEYAWLLYNKDPQYTGEPVRSLYQRLHRLDPDNREALWFLGLAAYQQRDFGTALGHWERLLASLPPQDPTAESLRRVIEKTRAEAARAAAEAARKRKP
jgi:cytochrome c-type biogenesis protein CcmH